jgi:hypothetical protein
VRSVFTTFVWLLAAALHSTIAVPVVQNRIPAPIVCVSESQCDEVQAPRAPAPFLAEKIWQWAGPQPTPGYHHHAEFALFQRPPPQAI